MFRGLKYLEETIQRLLTGHFIQLSCESKDLVKTIAHKYSAPIHRRSSRRSMTCTLGTAMHAGTIPMNWTRPRACSTAK